MTAEMPDLWASLSRRIVDEETYEEEVEVDTDQDTYEAEVEEALLSDD